MGEAHRMVREIAKAYEPRQIEPRWADFWVKEALFKPDVNAPGPVFSGTGPDAAAYGAAAGFPVGTRATASQVGNLVATYSHFDELFPSRLVKRATTPWLFKRTPEPTILYNFQSDRLSIDDYLSHNPTMGLLIVKDDTILYEHYRYARTDRDRFLSQSMAKTITAMLIGVAINENKIRSIDDTVLAYVPSLANTEYGKTSIQDLLRDFCREKLRPFTKCGKCVS